MVAARSGILGPRAKSHQPEEGSVTPIKQGTAQKLGLRKPDLFAVEAFEGELTRLSDELTALGFLGAIQAVGRVMHHFVGPSAERAATERWMRENGVKPLLPTRF